MPSRYTRHHLARSLGVHQRVDDDLFLSLLPFLPRGDGHDRIVWTCKTSGRIQQLESYGKEMRPRRGCMNNDSICVGWQLQDYELLSSL
jgi:hypothetical protein